MNNGKINIYGKDGTVLIEADVTQKDVYHKELMGEEYVLLSFVTDTPAALHAGDYIDTDFGRFEITEAEEPTYDAMTGGFVHEQMFYPLHGKWGNRIFKYFSDEVNTKETSFTLTQTPAYFLDLIAKNVKENGFGEYTYTYDASFLEMKTISFEADSITTALTKIAEAWKTEWWITDNVIHLSRCEYGSPVMLAVGEALTSMTPEASKEETYVTRLYAFGSDKNLPTNYRENTDNATEGVVVRRLHMPKGTDYVDAWPNMKAEDVVEGVAVFDEIFPRQNGSLTFIDYKEYTDEIKHDDGTTTKEKWNAIRFRDASVQQFKKEYILSGEELKMTFQTGKLAGMTFSVAFNPDGKPEDSYDSQLFEIIRWTENGISIPNETLRPHVGDEYVFVGLNTKYLGGSIVDDAEAELKAAAQEKVIELSSPHPSFTCQTNAVWCAGYRNGVYDALKEINLGVGQKVTLRNAAGEEYESRIRQFDKQLDVMYECSYMVGESSIYSKSEELKEKIDALGRETKEIKAVGNGVYLIKCYDRTKASDFNAYSALRTRQEFLSKLEDDFVKGKITFEQMIKVLGVSVMGGIHSGDASGKDTFIGGGLDGKGFGLYTDKNGDTNLEVDNIVARRKFTVNVLEIQKEMFAAGNYNLTDANGTVFRVYGFDGSGDVRARVFTAKDSAGNMMIIALNDNTSQEILSHVIEQPIIQRDITMYKLYFTREDDKLAVQDLWRNGDMALMKTLNLDRGQRMWHRVVTSHGTEVLEDGKEYNYIVVSNSSTKIRVVEEDGIEFVTGSDGTVTERIIEGKKYVDNVLGYDTSQTNAAPMVGDKVVQYGSVMWPSRQGVTKLVANGEGYGGMIVEEGIGAIIGTEQQFRAQRMPIQVCPRRVNLMADEFHICTRDSDGNITGLTEPTTYRLTAKEFASAADASAETCTTTFGLTVSEDKMSGSHMMTGADLMAAGFNLRAKLEGREWKKLPIESTAETHYDEGIFTDYPYIGDNKPKSMQCELYKENYGSAPTVIAATSFPIVVSGADGTSFQVKGQVAPKTYATMTEIEAETKLPTLWYLVHKNDKVSPASFHWIYKNPGGAFQAKLGDCYIENFRGHIYTAVEDGWLDLGAMKGVDGTDGKDAVVMEMTPAQLIITETENNAGYKDLDKHVKVMFRKGAEETAPVIQSIEATNCTASSANNEFWLTGVSDNVKECRCVITATDGTITITRSYDIYVNRLGTWEMTAKNDTMKSVSSQTYTYVDDNGQVVTRNGLSTIEQNAHQISTKVNDLNDGLAATGIDIVHKKIVITSDKVVVQNNAGEQTVLIDKEGKIAAALINAVQIVTEALSVSGTITANNLILGGKSQFGKFITNDEGLIVNNAYADTDTAVISTKNQQYVQKDASGEKMRSIKGFYHLGSSDYADYVRMKRPVISGSQMIGQYIDVAPTNKSYINIPGKVNAALWMENGTTVGLRPMLRRVDGTSGVVQLTKYDYTVMLIDAGQRIDIMMPKVQDIEDGQRIEIWAVNAINNTIKSHDIVFGDTNRRETHRVEHGHMKIFVYDANAANGGAWRVMNV